MRSYLKERSCHLFVEQLEVCVIDRWQWRVCATRHFLIKTSQQRCESRAVVHDEHAAARRFVASAAADVIV